MVQEENNSKYFLVVVSIVAVVAIVALWKMMGSSSGDSASSVTTDLTGYASYVTEDVYTVKSDVVLNYVIACSGGAPFDADSVVQKQSVTGTALVKGKSTEKIFNSRCGTSATKNQLDYYYCVDNKLHLARLTCKNGCKNNACVAPVTPEQPQNSCEDKEPAQDPAKKGEVLFNSQSFPDKCDQGKLYQYYCNAAGYIDAKPEDCTAGFVCDNGICKKQVVAGCSETDKGMDYLTKGVTTLNGIPYKDVCVDAKGKKVTTSNFLSEYSCEKHGATVKNCACKDGACTSISFSSCKEIFNETLGLTTLIIDKSTQFSSGAEVFGTQVLKKGVPKCLYYNPASGFASSSGFSVEYLGCENADSDVLINKTTKCENGCNEKTGKCKEFSCEEFTLYNGTTWLTMLNYTNLYSNEPQFIIKKRSECAYGGLVSPDTISNTWTLTNRSCNPLNKSVPVATNYLCGSYCNEATGSCY